MIGRINIKTMFEIIGCVTSIIMVIVTFLSYKAHKTTNKISINTSKIMERANQISEANNLLLERTEIINKTNLDTEIIKHTPNFIIELKEIDFENDANKMDSLDEDFFNYARVKGTLGIKNESDFYIHDLCLGNIIEYEKSHMGKSISPGKEIELDFSTSLDSMDRTPEYINGDKHRIYKHQIKISWNSVYDFEGDVVFYFCIVRTDNNSGENFKINPVISWENDRSNCHITSLKVSIKEIIKDM